MTLSVAPPLDNLTSNVTAQKHRVALWDNLKFILISCVVIGHLIDFSTRTVPFSRSIFLFIYSFHMPLFIFICGLLFSYKNIKNKICLYLIYGISLKIVLFTTGLLVKNSIPRFNTLSDFDIPWFLFAIAAYFVLANLLKDINKYFVFFFSIVLACFVGYDRSIGDWLYLSRIIVFFPFFWLGLILSSNKVISHKENRKTLKTAFAVLFVGIVIYICIKHIDTLYQFRALFTGRNPFPKNMLDYGLLARAGCYVISFLMCYALIVLTPNINIPIITTWGSRTLHVYFWHWPIILVLLYFIPTAKPTGVFGSIPFGFVVTCFCSMRYCSIPLNWLKKISMKPSNT